MSRHEGSNDQRSNVKNPNNPAYVPDRDNRIHQGHPNPPPPPPQQGTNQGQPAQPTKK